MAGNSSIRGDETITFTDNMSFDGTDRGGKMVLDGQLWIGATASNRADNGGHVRLGSLTSPLGTVTIGYSAPNITLETTGGQGLTKIGVDTVTATGTNPVLPTAAGLITFMGGQYATGTFGSRVITINSQSPNNLQILAQISSAVAAGDSTKNGFAHFDSASFSVSAAGFVTLSGSNITLTGDTGGALSPTAGNFDIVTNSESGSTIQFDGSGSTLTLNVTDAGNNTIIGNLAGNGSLTATACTALGFSALNALTSGVNNVAMGANALILAQTSENNVAIGTHALASLVTGGFSTAVGSLCMTSSTNGGTAVGYAALGALTTGQNNCCVGFSSGGSLINGNNNTAIGQNSGATWSASSDCTALGDAALFASTGDRNTAVGSQAIFGAGASANNTVVGYQTGLNITSGSQNSLLGYQTLVNGTSASYNVCIGYTSGNAYTTSESSNIIISNTGTVAESNVIRIGTSGSGSGQQNKCFIAGIDGVTITGAAVLCSATGQLGDVVSSVRFKEEIEDIKNSSDILNLRPVTFKYKSEEKKHTHYGLIAEEVEKVCPSLVIYDNEGRPYSVAYHEMPALLLQEIKKLRLELEQLKLKVA